MSNENIIAAFFTIYALFGDEVRLLFFQFEQDTVFYTISTIALFSLMLKFLLTFMQNLSMASVLLG